MLKKVWTDPNDKSKVKTTQILQVTDKLLEHSEIDALHFVNTVLETSAPSMRDVQPTRLPTLHAHVISHNARNDERLCRRGKCAEC